jgi:hypothetical protein
MTYGTSYAPACTASYAPAYTAAYAPAYTAAYAPTTYTAAYRPYITAYAPLQAEVVTTSYAPSTVYRPVEMAPVVETSVAPACSACSANSGCSACSSCSSGVSQAMYEGAPAGSSCPACAASTSGATYYGDNGAPAQGGITSEPATPTPTVSESEAIPGSSSYPPEAPASQSNQNNGAAPANGVDAPEKNPVDPKALPDEDASKPAGADSSTSLDFGAPPLIGPRNGDRTAHRPTVEIHDAVYRQPVRQSPVSTTSAKKVTPVSTGATVKANGWYSVESR